MSGTRRPVLASSHMHGKFAAKPLLYSHDTMNGAGVHAGIAQGQEEATAQGESCLFMSFTWCFCISKGGCMQASQKGRKGHSDEENEAGLEQDDLAGYSLKQHITLKVLPLILPVLGKICTAIWSNQFYYTCLVSLLRYFHRTFVICWFDA